MKQGSPHIAVTGRRFRLIFGSAQQWEAYKLEERSENHNLYAELKDDDEIRRLRGVIEARLAQSKGVEDRRLEITDEGLKERLKALGYFD